MAKADVDINLKSFLDMIAWSEGTTRIKGSDDGYNVIVGGSLFHDYSKHPKKLIHINKNLASTAAGRYQLLSRYYNHYKDLLGLNDFSPISQDLIALQQIKERRAIPMILAGDIQSAIKQCSNIWASFPGNSYGQHMNKMDKLIQIYEEAKKKYTDET